MAVLPPAFVPARLPLVQGGEMGRARAIRWFFAISECWGCLPPTTGTLVAKAMTGALPGIALARVSRSHMGPRAAPGFLIQIAWGGVSRQRPPPCWPGQSAFSGAGTHPCRQHRTSRPALPVWVLTNRRHNLKRVRGSRHDLEPMPNRRAMRGRPGRGGVHKIAPTPKRMNTSRFLQVFLPRRFHPWPGSGAEVGSPPGPRKQIFSRPSRSSSARDRNRPTY